MQTLPFLYLPDTVSLILLIVTLGMLRSAAVCHLRQELLVLRKELLILFLSGNGSLHDPLYADLKSLIETSMRLAPTLSPARLLFVFRYRRLLVKRGCLPPAPVHRCVRVDSAAAGTEPKQREKLRRYRMELHLGLGTFFLLGSISGWGLLLTLIPGMIRRSLSHRPGHRIDTFFDLTERILGRIGRRALRLAIAADSKSYFAW